MSPTDTIVLRPLAKKSFGPSLALLSACVLLSLMIVPACHAESSNEIGAGIGMDYDCQNARQAFAYIAHQWDSERYGFLGYRIEASADVISNGSSIVIGTLMPAARFYYPTGSAWRPFFDIGAGVSLKHGNLVGGRYLEGPVAFTLMSALGVEYKTDGGRRLALSTRFKHLSNSGLYSSNHGFNAQYIVLSVGF